MDQHLRREAHCVRMRLRSLRGQSDPIKPIALPRSGTSREHRQEGVVVHPRDVDESKPLEVRSQHDEPCVES
jgi:hypothetical protein